MASGRSVVTGVEVVVRGVRGLVPGVVGLRPPFTDILSLDQGTQYIYIRLRDIDWVQLSTNFLFSMLVTP